MCLEAQSSRDEIIEMMKLDQQERVQEPKVEHAPVSHSPEIVEVVKLVRQERINERLTNQCRKFQRDRGSGEVGHTGAYQRTYR